LSKPDFTGFDLQRLVHAGKLKIAFGELQEKQISFQETFKKHGRRGKFYR
jgi:hypothetical protein